MAEGRGDRVVILCGDRRLTYRDVQALVNRVGNALRVAAWRIDGPYRC